MKFQRGKDPKEVLDLGIKEEKGYNITGITDKNIILPGVHPDHIYTIVHTGARTVRGFCSGKKLIKVLISLMKNKFSNYKYKWIWDPHPQSGGNLLFYYGNGDENDWTDANNSMGYSFSRMGEGSIIEL